MYQLRPAPVYLYKIMFPILTSNLQIPGISVGKQRYSRSKQIPNPDIHQSSVVTQAQMAEMLRKYLRKGETNRLRRGLLTALRQWSPCKLKIVVETGGAKLHRRIRKIYLKPSDLGLIPHPTMTSPLLRRRRRCAFAMYKGQEFLDRLSTLCSLERVLGNQKRLSAFHTILLFSNSHRKRRDT